MYKEKPFCVFQPPLFEWIHAQYRSVTCSSPCSLPPGAAMNKGYGSPPKVGEPAHPGSFGKPNSWPGLPSRPHFVSDSSVTLRVTRGASRGLRPSLREPLRGRARSFRHLPLRARLRAVLGLHLTVQQKHRARPLTGTGRRGVAPNELLTDLSPYGLRLVRQNSSAPPPGLPPGPGLAPPLCQLRPPVRYAPGLRPEMAKRLPAIALLDDHVQTHNARRRGYRQYAAREITVAQGRPLGS